MRSQVDIPNNMLSRLAPFCGSTASFYVLNFVDIRSRDEYNSYFGEGAAPLILARTDALKTDGFEAAIERCLAFREVGCDMTFLEAPESIEQMKEYNRRVGGAKLANMLEQGFTPILPPQELKRMGYTMAAYPLTLLSASIKAMQESLERIKAGAPTDDIICSCKSLGTLYVDGNCEHSMVGSPPIFLLVSLFSFRYEGRGRFQAVRKRRTKIQSINS